MAILRQGFDMEGEQVLYRTRFHVRGTDRYVCIGTVEVVRNGVTMLPTETVLGLIRVGQVFR